MEREVWLTAAEAVNAGFADYAEPIPARMAASFDYRKYAHAPDRLTVAPGKANAKVLRAGVDSFNARGLRADQSHRQRSSLAAVMDNIRKVRGGVRVRNDH